MANDLKQLEEQSIGMIKDAATRFKSVAVLWSAGKDSTALLYMARKALGGKITVLHLDSGDEFPETYAFRDDLAKKLKLNLITVPIGDGKKKAGCDCRCLCNDQSTLGKAASKQKFDAVVSAAIKGDGPGKGCGCCDSGRDDCSSKPGAGKGVIVSPLMDWSDLDVWNYTKQEKIPINPLYFSRNGQRYSNVCCRHCSKQIKSDAKNVDQIIKELGSSSKQDTTPGAKDYEKEQMMKRLRALGYV